MGDRMQDVELEPLDAPAPGTAPAVRRLRLTRRHLLRGGAVALVLVAAVVGTQLVLDARAGDRVAAARAVPGVIGYDVDRDLTATPAPTLLGLDAGEVRVLPVVGPDRLPAVQGLDAATGDVRWETSLAGAEGAQGAQPPEGGPQEWPSCSTGGPDVRRVTCLVVDRLPPTGDDTGGWMLGAPARTRLVTLDTATGAVLAEREMAPAASAQTAGGDLVVVEVSGGVVRLSAEDAVTGRVRWSTGLPADPGTVDGQTESLPQLQVTDAHVVTTYGPYSWAARRSDGILEAAGSAVQVGRGDRLVVTGADGLTRLGGADGTGDAVAVGAPAWFTVDDGSSPGLELLTDLGGTTQRLRAVDHATGVPAWETELPGTTGVSLILLRDVLYGADAEDVWALDVATGVTRWRSPRDPGGADPDGLWPWPMTDGRRLLMGVRTSEDADALRAWSLDSGERLWTTPLPQAGRGGLVVLDHVLYGTWDDPVRLGG
ncbi:PQQ-like beta-propeller repeat protein [Cellulomonas hominis]|uniref:outer membrane protein assembly factor BamB family protein n=1 Tax=Cellulomonas hominis TaxID=156981 RepID=UPI001C11498F|nr:PQQ-binding-like beta-propeller repeat protein [Cellulomonas hominis]MBU5423027.1 PQQ-like beta-propeller repeat protein [Cellulomonas hominis]